MVLPSGQIFAIENRFQPERLQLDVLELDLAAVELQADIAAAAGGGIVVSEHLFAIELDGRLAAIKRHFKRLPFAGPLGHRLAFQAANEAAGGEWVLRRGNVQRVALRFDVVHADDRGGPQEQAAVGVLRGPEVALENVVVELHAGAEQPFLARCNDDRSVLHLPIGFAVGLPAKQGLAVEQRDPSRGQFFIGERLGRIGDSRRHRNSLGSDGGVHRSRGHRSGCWLHRDVHF